MPLDREYFSASSGTLFVECPAKWATNYDEDRNVRSRNDYSDIGSLVHRALEIWRNPDSECTGTFEELQAAFEQASIDYTFAEPLRAFKRGHDLLAAAYNLSIYHPTIPIQEMQILAVEQSLVQGEDGTDWKMGSWIQPARGQIDLVGLIPTFKGKPNEIILFLEDYKTGRPKTHDVLVNEEIQPPLYFLYMRDQMVPYIESQIASNGENYKVTRIVGSWTYVGEGTAVPLYESDFDHEMTEKYVANLQKQMAEFSDKYNEFQNHLQGALWPQGKDGDKERANAEIKWLTDYEKPNAYCSYCPRKNQCQTFQRLLSYEGKVDITGPNMDWDAIYEELTAYQAIEKNASVRVKDIKDMVPVYLDQERLESIPLANGKELVANVENRKKYLLAHVQEILGKEFVLENATITDTAIKREIDLIASTDPERAKEVIPLLDAASIPIPFSRPVRARNAESAAKRKNKK